VVVQIDEKMACQVDKDGGLKKLEVNGELKVTILDPDAVTAVIRTTGLQAGKIKMRQTINPRMNETAWKESGVMQLKDPGKPYRVGTDNAVVTFKWKMSSDEESDVPLTFTVWPQSENNRTVVSIEYSANASGGLLPSPVLTDLHVFIPCRGSRQPPTVTHCDTGSNHHYDAKDKTLVWSIESVSAAAAAEGKNKGTLEFNVAECDPASFYPVTVVFSSTQLCSRLQVKDVLASAAPNAKALSFRAETSLTVDKFSVEAE